MKQKFITTGLVTGILGFFLALTALADKSGDTGATVKPSKEDAGQVTQQRIKEGVQVSELGCMRVYLTYNEEASALKPRIEQAFSDVDFRIFPADRIIASKYTEEPDVAVLWKIDNLRKADLVFHAALQATEQKALGNFKRYESVATVQLYNVNSKELLATHTSRKTGERNADDEKAKRSANEAAMDDALKSIIAKCLGKAHKVLVHEVQITGIENERQLLGVMEYTGRLDGVYHVRRMWLDEKAKNAGIEIIGAPQTETFWRAYIDQMPRPGKPATGSTKKVGGKTGAKPAAKSGSKAEKTELKVVPNKKLREKYPDWFAE